MSYASYAEDLLPDFSFISGNNYTLDFLVFEEDGFTPMDLSGATFYWVLAPFGQPDYVALKVTGTAITGGFSVELTSEMTNPVNGILAGYYIQQPVIVAISGQEYRPGQGTCVIKTRIPLTN